MFRSPHAPWLPCPRGYRAPVVTVPPWPWLSFHVASIHLVAMPRGYRAAWPSSPLVTSYRACSYHAPRTPGLGVQARQLSIKLVQHLDSVRPRQVAQHEPTVMLHTPKTGGPA